MTLEGIETFLKVHETRSIVKASEALEISQSTCSLRIQNLEKELGVTLLERHQGKKETILTRAGEKFLPIAFRWQRLYQETLQLKDESYSKELKIASVDSINSFLLFDFYPLFTNNHPEIFLNIKTYYSKQMYQLVSNHETDLAICTENHPYINIHKYLLYEEPFVVLVHKSHPFATSKLFKDLKNVPEVYVRHSDELEQWRNEFNYNYNLRFIQVGNISDQVDYITYDTSRWGVIPLSTAMNFTQSNSDYCYIELDSSSPKRKISLITSKELESKTKDTIQLFCKELKLYLKNHDYLISQI